jgi:asparagine synthase (glutamine-hydrolysing)
MCGIGGYVGPGSARVLETMTRLLQHRGPDASGTWIGEGAGLANTRLAILDLSLSGRQPMADEGAGVHVTFNGEIYNFRELRVELESAGYRFRGRSDTEVLLYGYRHWGEAVLERLRGMFGFAIWDERQRRLFLARDRAGIKPLFYAPGADGMIFASEIKALFAHPALSIELETPAVDAYLALGYVPGPGTIFRGVRALPPGHWLRWQAGRLEIGHYWAPDSRQPVLEGGEDELIAELDARLNDAVRSHLVADVPVGAFLSGGLDSSLVAAIAQRHLTAPLTTFTIGFSGGGDERAFARQVARHIGSQHHERLAEPILGEELPSLVWHLEQPLFDNSVLPTHLVSQLAREQVKVVLSGDGGDEPFAGYDWTRWAVVLPTLPLPSLGNGWEWAYRRGGIGMLQRLYADVSRPADERYVRRMVASRAFRHWLYTPEYLAQIGTDPVDDFRVRLREAPLRDPREAFVYADLRGFLPEDILVKVDRMSMAHGLEVRVPLLDHHLLEWVLRLPWAMRFRRGRGKHLLRRVAARYLPASILKPRKQGFTVPVGRWLQGELGDLTRALFASEAFAGRGIVRPDRALQLLAMHRSGRYDLGHRIWSLVVLETWCRVWLDGQSHANSLRAMLAESSAVV